MKKFLSILLAALMIAGLVPALFAGAETGASTKATAITADKNGRTYHYYESFDTDATVQGADKVFNTLGWSLPDNAELVSAHADNVEATEKNSGVFMYEIKNGRLYLRNRGSKDEYMLLVNAGELADVFDGAYVIEYTMTYLPSSTSTADGYAALIYGANARLNQYGTAALRISGWGDSYIVLGDMRFPLDRGDVSTVLSKEASLTAYRVDNDRNMTLYEKLCGNVDNVPGTANVVDLRGSKVMIDVEMRVRMEFDGVVGPRVYVNDILISDPRNIRDDAIRSAVQTNYEYLLSTSGSALAFCVTPGIDCVLDEITVYETRSEIASSLYITEIATLPGNPLAPYIEVYNAGDEAVDLSAYAVGYVALGENGKETVVGVPFAGALDQSLTLGEATLDNLSATDAVLEPGEMLVIFPVDTAADVAELVNTVDGVTLAGFRAEYGLDANAKVVAITDPAFKVDATEHRFWFVGDAKNEKGKDMAWSTYTLNLLKNSDAVQSIVELVPSIAFGYEGDITDTSVNADGAYNFGGDGHIMSGYSAQYFYGMDASANDRVGLMITRCTELIDDARNVGALLDVQADYFEKIADFRAGYFDTEGALVITEMVPVTENDAFDSFEITNISAKTLNLYDFGLVSSGDAKYGSLSAWTRASQFELNPVKGIVNPSVNGEYPVAPGSSVVVWNMTVAGYTVNDFRAYHGIAANVPVVVLNSMKENNVIAANVGTVTYGVASARSVSLFLGGTLDRVNEAVSDVTVPLHSLHYEIDGQYRYTWQELLDAGNMTIISALALENFPGCEMLGVRLNAGDSLDGYFVRETVDGKELYRLCEAGSTVAENDTTEYFMPKDTELFAAYGSKQELAFPKDRAVVFSYGSGIYASKSSGSLMQSMQVSSYKYDEAARGYGSVPYLLSVANAFVTADLTSAAKVHTLGTTEAKQGVDISVKFNHYYTVTVLDANGEAGATVTLNAETCGDVYTVLSDEHDTWLVNDVFYQAGDVVDITGETVIKPGVLGVSDRVNASASNNNAMTSMDANVPTVAEKATGSTAAYWILAVSVVAVVGAMTTCMLITKKNKA